MRLVWHSIVLPEYEHHSPLKLKKMPGLISEKGMLLHKITLNKTKLQGPSLYTSKNDQVTSCSATNVICSIYLLILFHSQQGKRPFSPKSWHLHDLFADI